MTRKLTRRLFASSIALVALLALPTSAVGATTVSRSGGTVVITAAGVDLNTITVRRITRNVGGFPTPFIEVEDLAGEVAGSGCSSSGGNVMCNALGITAISAALGHGNDRITLSRTTNAVPAGISSSLDGGDHNDTLNGGAGPDSMTGGTGADTFNGFEGTDTVSYADHPSGTVIADVGLFPNDGNSTDGPLGARDTIAADIENLTGGPDNSVLTGSAGANTLQGGSGHDTLIGLAGADTLSGGEGGTDTASYAERSDSEPVVVDIGGGTNDGGPLDGPVGARDDVQTSIDQLTGGAGDDELTGDSGRNRIRGGSGADDIDGAGGPDGASVPQNNPGTCLASGVSGGLYGEGGDDHIVGGSDRDDIEGGSGNDTLEALGGPDADIYVYPPCPGPPIESGGVSGGPGTDTLDGGTGADSIEGGEDVDTATYEDRSAPVIADIGGGSDDGDATDEDPDTGTRDDILDDVENLIGGSAGDTLTGDGDANVLTGEGGADTLFGLAGADTLDGGGDGDTLNGGADIDGFLAGAGADELQAFDGNAESVNCGSETDIYTADGADTLTDCETNMADGDLDGVPDVSDNCSALANPDQENNDLDAEGDACDPDDDNDTVLDPDDSCEFLAAATVSGCPAATSSLTLTYSSRRERFTGKASSAQAACHGARQVTVFSRAPGPDEQVGQTTTLPNGAYKLNQLATPGRYYARVGVRVVADTAQCGAAKSPSLRVQP